MRKRILFLALVVLVLLPACASLPKPRPWTREEKALLVVSVLAAGADLYTTERMLDRGHYEENQFIGEHPTDRELLIKFPLLSLAAWTICHFCDVMRPALLGCKIVINTGCAIHNSKLD